MSSIYRDIHSQPSVTIQPQPNVNLEPESIDLKQSIPVHEKSLEADSLEKGHHHCHCEYGQTSFSEDHSSCHSSNSQLTRRQVFLSATSLFLALGGLLTWSCVNGMPAIKRDGLIMMGRRALDDNLPVNSTSNQSRVTLPPGSPKPKGQLAPLIHGSLNSNLTISAISSNPRNDYLHCSGSVCCFIYYVVCILPRVQTYDPRTES